MKQRFWRGLLAALAMGFAGKTFGVVGVLVVAVLMAALWRWPKPQVIAASILTVALFVVTLLVPTAHYNQMLAIGHAPSPPRSEASEPSAVPQSDSGAATPWTRDVATFEAAHPNLRAGRNIQIMQSKTNMFVTDAMPNQTVLQGAYELARIDPNWTYSIKLDFVDPYADPPAGLAFVNRVVADAQECIRQGRSQVECIMGSSPIRCRQGVTSIFEARTASDMSNRFWSWKKCVISCAASAATICVRTGRYP